MHFKGEDLSEAAWVCLRSALGKERMTDENQNADAQKAEYDRYIELEVRRILSEEAGTYREFLQRQFRYLAWSVGIIATVGAAVFVFLFSDRADKVEKRLVQTVDAKIIEYRISEGLKARINSLVDVRARSEETALAIRNQVTKEAEEAVASNAEAIVRDAVREEISKTRSLNVAQLISRAVMPSGSVVAFDRAKCPDDWDEMPRIAGRVIVGVGQGTGLSMRTRGEFGGSEEHSLSLNEMPRHRHGIPVNAGSGLGLVLRPNLGLPGATSGVEMMGSGKPHNNMPPYIALLFCKKK